MTRSGLSALVVTELRLHRRHGVWAAAAATAAIWCGVLLALPADWREPLVPWLLMLEVATLGLVATPALAVVERAHGVSQMLRLTGLPPAPAIAVRVGLLSGYAVLVAVAVLAASGSSPNPGILGTVAASSALLSLLALLLVGRTDTLTAYLARLPLAAAPLLGPAMLHGTGLVRHPLLDASPATAAFRLLSGEVSLPAAAWMLCWVAALFAAAVRIGFDVRPVRPVGPPRTGRQRRRPGITRARRSGVAAAARSFAQADLRSLLHDRLLLMLLAGLPIIAVAARWFGDAGVGLVLDRSGVDLTPHLPAVWTFVLVIHVPVMVGTIAGLMWSEDRDAGLLPALATVPAALQVLVAYRLGAAALAAAAALTAILAVAGALPAAGLAGLAATAVAGGIAATVPAALTAALARDRVQAVAIMKIMTVPLYLPVAWWFLETPAAWLLAAVPTAGAARAFWAASAVDAALSALGAAGITAVLLTLLVPRMLRTSSV